ncbi:hypothetical protein CWI69_10590 [Pseudidiomarina halophila]|uniref:RHS protein conserved region domain-containing protein n=2 Tax=Pseudidiomarina halophila TaxID=1449799 RepID=A0A432XTL7_9GAMM|nr:hypothetical protein CWI69_10590 [Pseudidiomarina halophila]
MEKETNTWTYGGDNRVRRLTRSSGFYYENWYDANELYFVHNDHLGRPHKVTDDTKAVVWEADLQSFDRSVVNSSIPTSMFNQYGNRVTPSELADMMEKQGYDGKQPVKLHSCETGSKGTSSFAQKLANQLNQPVTAPSVPYLMNTNGWQGLQSDGEWVTFRPQNGGN